MSLIRNLAEEKRDLENRINQAFLSWKRFVEIVKDEIVLEGNCRYYFGWNGLDFNDMVLKGSWHQKRKFFLKKKIADFQKTVFNKYREKDRLLQFLEQEYVEIRFYSQDRYLLDEFSRAVQRAEKECNKKATIVVC